MTREKQDSASRHTVMDLSWPNGFSVNDAVHKCKYLDSYLFVLVGPGALLYEVDISRAF